MKYLQLGGMSAPYKGFGSYFYIQPGDSILIIQNLDSGKFADGGISYADLHSNVQDSLGNVDTTYLPFTTYVADHAGSGGIFDDSTSYFINANAKYFTLKMTTWRLVYADSTAYLTNADQTDSVLLWTMKGGTLQFGPDGLTSMDTALVGDTMFFLDHTAKVFQDGSGNLSFEDGNAGTVTLSDLASPAFADSADNITDGGVDLADLGTEPMDSIRRGYPTAKYIYLTHVYSYNTATGDSVFLNDNVVLAGDSFVVIVDSAGNITPNVSDTAALVAYLPDACTIDSVQILYRTTATILEGHLRGPRQGAGDFNLADSAWQDWTGADSLYSTTWDTALYDVDIAAAAGSRWAYNFIAEFTADNERVHIAWARVKVTY
jgi:hypothetical protein